MVKLDTAMSTPWNHVVCWPCWRDLAASWGQPEREPYQVKGSSWQACCFCGVLTNAGIYVRRPPTSPDLLCRGNHDEPDPPSAA